MQSPSTPASTGFTMPSAYPFLGSDVWGLLADTADAAPDSPLLTWQPFDADARTWTYGEFRTDCEAVAASLQERGAVSYTHLRAHET